MKSNNVKVDVVIPTYKPGKELFRLVKALNRQTHPINRIIIINTEKQYLQDDFADVSNVEIFHIRTEEFDHGATRDLGMSQSTSPFVVFLTQDSLPYNSQLIESLLVPFEDDLVAVSYARQLPATDCNYIERYIRGMNYPDSDRIKSKRDVKHMGMKAFFCSNVCAMYRRDIYIAYNGFVKKTIFNEDMIYGRKVILNDKKIAYVSKALVIHSHNYNLKQQFQRSFDMGVSQKEYSYAFEGVRTENEGLKILKSAMKHLIIHDKVSYIPLLILICGCRFIGYKLGKAYTILPKEFVVSCSMNKNYWK